MASKKQLIDEIFEICDSIIEKSYKNQQSLDLLIQKYPLNEGIQSFQLMTVQQFEDLSRSQLKQLTMDQLQYLLEDTSQGLDQVMNEELQINKLGLRISKTPIEMKNHESWDFLLQWPKATNIDSIIINVKSITNNILGQLHRSNLPDDQDDLQQRYHEALTKIESLESQLDEQQNNKTKQIPCLKNIINQKAQQKQYLQPKDKLELMDELERKLQDLEVEKQQMSQTSMDAFSRLLSTKL